MPLKKDQNATQRLLEVIRSKDSSAHLKQDAGKKKTFQGFKPEDRPKDRSENRPGQAVTVKEPVVGVDLKNQAIRIVVCSKNKSGFALHAWHEETCPHALGTQDFVQQLQKALRSVFSNINKKTGFKPRIWVTGDFSVEDFQLVNIPRVSKKQIPWTLLWTLKNEGQANLENSILDFEILGERIDKGVTKTRILAALLSKKEVNQIQKAFDKAGFKLAGVTSTSLALLSMFKSGVLSFKEQNRAVIYMEDEGSRIDIAQNNTLLMHRQIRTGLNSIVEEYDNAQAESTEISTKQGDSLQKNKKELLYLLEQKQDDPETSEQDADVKAALDLVQPAYIRLIRQVERTFSYHTRTMGYDPVERVYLCGELAALLQVRESFARELGVEVQVLDPFAGKVHLLIPAPESLTQRIQFAGAMGLGLSESCNVLNFIETFQDRLQHRQQRLIWMASTAAIFGLLFFMAGFEGWQFSRLHSGQRALEEKKQELLKDENRLQDLEQQYNEVKQNRAVAEYRDLKKQVQEKRDSWDRYVKRYKPVAILSSFLSLVPENVSINELYTYFQDEAREQIEFIQQKKEERDKSDTILYSDEGGWFKLRLPEKGRKSGERLFKDILVVNGILTSQPETMHLALDDFKEDINKSPFFEVLYSFDEKHMFPDLGNVLKFKLVIQLS